MVTNIFENNFNGVEAGIIVNDYGSNPAQAKKTEESKEEIPKLSPEQKQEAPVILNESEQASNKYKFLGLLTKLKKFLPFVSAVCGLIKLL